MQIVDRLLQGQGMMRFSMLGFALALGAPALAASSSGLAAVPAVSQPRDEPICSGASPQQIEQDWLRQAMAIEDRAIGPVSTQTDARGACDGVKDGKYGFHTAHEANPWWQVDLGEAAVVTRIQVFNRLDYAPGLHNADKLRVLSSADGQNWTLQYENAGAHFGGISGAKTLQVDFAGHELRTRFVRLQIPSEEPVFFHLDEVEVYGPAPECRNLALHRPADQSSVSEWSTAKRLGDATAPRRYPTAEFIESGRRLARDLQAQGVSSQVYAGQLQGLEQRLAGQGQNVEDRRRLYLETRWVLRQLVFANPLLDFERLLFVKRFTQESHPDICLNHMPWVSKPGGDICILSAPTGATRFAGSAPPPMALAPPTARIRHLLAGALGPGHVHGMDLGWDGDRVVFGFARGCSDQPPEGWLDRSQSYRLRRSEEPTHIYEIGLDGGNLRQLTWGEWSDLDPTYAPNGDIVFVSERCGTSLQCNEYDKDETSCNLYVMRPDGTGIRRLSANKDGDYLPHSLDDGTIAYTRWEYHERSWAFIQSIWTIHPDGTGADAVFKQHLVNPWALEDTRSIPGSKKLVAIAAGHHTLAAGPLVVVNPSAGLNEPKAISIVTPDVQPPEGGMDGVPVSEGGVREYGGFYSTPWALSEKHFLASYSYAPKQTDAAGYGLYLVDVFGNKELLFRDPAISCFMPVPLRPRPRPPVLPELVDLRQTEAVCVLTEASFGSEGIRREQVRYIRIAEPIGWPYDVQRGGNRYGEDHAYSGPGADQKNLLSWTPIRILGDVPVERDGSAHFRLPADTAVYFQLLDENRMELRRMRSFISFQPGETRACVGCHESRATAPPASVQMAMAALRQPSDPVPPPWGDRPGDFLRDIQPILDRHCVRCHDGLAPGGGLDFSPGLTSHDRTIPGYGFNRAYETIMANGLVSVSKVRAQDASVTPALAYGSHKSKLTQALRKQPQVTEEERLRLSMWIDANAPYHDGFVEKRPDQPAYDLAADRDLQTQLTVLHAKRCASCHNPVNVSRLDWIDLRQPERSLFLRAPLANESGAQGRCPSGTYANASDGDYQAVCQLVTDAVQKAWRAPRRDLRNCPGSAEIPAGL